MEMQVDGLREAVKIVLVDDAAEEIEETVWRQLQAAREAGRVRRPSLAERLRAALDEMNAALRDLDALTDEAPVIEVDLPENILSTELPEPDAWRAWFMAEEIQLDLWDTIDEFRDRSYWLGKTSVAARSRLERGFFEDDHDTAWLAAFRPRFAGLLDPHRAHRRWAKRVDLGRALSGLGLLRADDPIRAIENIAAELEGAARLLDSSLLESCAGLDGKKTARELRAIAGPLHGHLGVAGRWTGDERE